jgi:hypothetical protein
MYKFIAGLLIILTPGLSQAQFGNMLKKAKNTVVSGSKTMWTRK